jgi:hypothetical protein
MTEALRQLRVPNSLGPSLFFFATRNELRESGPLALGWNDGSGRKARLV